MPIFKTDLQEERNCLQVLLIDLRMKLVNGKKLNKHLVRSYVKYLLSKAMRTVKLLQTFVIKVVDNLSLYFVLIIHYTENPYFPT